MDPDALDDHLDQSVVHGRIIPRPAGRTARAARRRRPMARCSRAIDRADHEAADVGEERDAAAALDRAERGQPVDELEDEPEARGR